MGTLSVVVLAALVAVVAMLLRTRDGVAAPGPRLSPDLPAALLLRAGFPVTGHNERAVRDRLASSFVAGAQRRSPELAARVADALGDTPAGPQEVLDAVAAFDPAAAVSLASRVPEELLATAGTGHGFFGGSVFAPLPPAPAPSVSVSAASSVAAAAVPSPRVPSLPVPQPLAVSPTAVVAPVVATPAG